MVRYFLGAAEMNVDLTAADIRAAGPDGAAAGESNQQNPSSSMRPANGATGGASQRDNAGVTANSSGRMPPNHSGAGGQGEGMDGSGRADENAENSGQRRSIISSIR